MHQNPNLNFEEIIQLYHLEAHPEGGYYKRSYQSSEKISKEALPPRFEGVRFISTAIYYLLPKGQKSKLHRIKSDETWHFYLGGPLTIVGIDKNGSPYEVMLGHDVRSGQSLQYTVPANHWFAASPNPGTEFSFVGCAVAPGFDFDDFEIGDKTKLLAEYPAAMEIINKFSS